MVNETINKNIDKDIEMHGKEHVRAFVREFGKADQCVILERYVPENLLPDMVRVRMLFSTINPSDLITISGAYKSRVSLPFVPGFEGVGRISDIGTSATNFNINQCVLPIGSMGAWQTSRNIEEKWCFSVPDGISEQQAATGYINPMTALLIMSERLLFKDNVKLIINAANSTIGRMLIRIANHMKVYPIAIMRKKPGKDFITDCDVQSIIISGNSDYHHELDKIKKSGGVDAVLDCVGGDDAMYTSRTLKQGGQFIHYGLLSGKAIPPKFWKERSDIDFSHFHLRHWIHNSDRAAIQIKINEVMDLIKENIIYTNISDVFNLNELPLVINSIMAGKIKEKILIRC